MITANTRDL